MEDTTQTKAQLITELTALGLGGPLLVVAVLGKLVGTGAPAWFTVGGTSALLLGVSMVPQAEIAMVIMQRGVILGDWAVPAQVFAAMVMVSAVTCMITPFVVHALLRKYPQAKEEATGGSQCSTDTV